MLLNFRVGLALLVVLCASMAGRTYAQSIGGTILGVVKDASGPVPQAEVRITNIATGQSRFWLTDDQGRYELREVPPGLYELKVSKEGYATFSTTASGGLQLNLTEVAHVGDITLSVAPVAETRIEVKSVDVAMTDSETAMLGTTFDEKQVRALPLSARDVNNLGPLAPGVVSVSSFNVANTLVAFAAGGSRGRDNNFIIDSVDNNDPLFGGAATQFTNSEIFDQFRILTGQYQAEYGRNSGSIVNVTTRQGGRDFHGSLDWFAQNDAFNAMTKVEKQSGLTKPAPFRENQVGATVSGPIRRDSTWFFLSYQWDRARNDLSSQYPVITTLPTAQGLAILEASNAVTPSPTLSTFLADPLVQNVPAQPSPCGPFPAFSYIYSNPQNICTTGSLATLNNVPIPFGIYLIPEANVSDLRDHEAFARIDQKAGERDNFFFRYLFDDLLTPLAPSSSVADTGLDDTGLLPEWRNFLASRTQNFGSAWTHASNRALNELRLSYSRVSSRIGPLHANSQQGETPAITVYSYPGFVPSINFAYTAGFGFTLGRDSQPARLNNNVYQLQENYSFAHGIHDIKLGGNFIETRSSLDQIPGDLGHYYYVFSFQNFVANLPDAGTLRFGNINGKGGESLPLREMDQFYFVQDDLHISPNFTLNLGLRYENYGPSFNAVVNQSESTSTSPPKIDRVFMNFAPRLGFAWGLGQRTVVRGGYGIYYNPTFLDIALLVWQSGPISPFVQFPAGGYRPTNVYPNPPFVSADAAVHPFVAGCYGGSVAPPGPSNTDCTTQNTVSKDLRNPFVQTASLGVQIQVRRDVLFEASYFGSRGTRLFQRMETNPAGSSFIVPCAPAPPGAPPIPCPEQQLPPPQPNRGFITEITNGGFSTYNALQLSAIKRLRGSSIWSGLALSASYAWSHMIDNASDPFGSSVLQRLALPTGSTQGFSGFLGFSRFRGIPLPGEPQPDPTSFAQNPADTRDGEKGNSSFDRRHRVALSFVWGLPVPAKKAHALFRDWLVTGVFTAESGEPFSPLNGLGGNCPSGLLGEARPNIGNPHAPEDTVALLNNVYCFDPNSTVPGVAALAQMFPYVPGAGPYITPSGQTVDPSTVRFVQVPLAGTGFGNAGRNILTGPASANLDLSLSKSIPLGERFKVQLRGEVFDLLNRENPGPFAGNSFISGWQPVSSSLWRPDTDIAFSGTPASLSGLTPENSIDADAFYGFKSTFLSRTNLTTSSRRVQLSLKISF